MNSTRTRIAITLAAMLLAAVAHLGALYSVGREYTEAGLKRALITFGIARGLNGVISVAQGTEIAVEPVGIGVTFTPGQILDPVNDLIERFSWIMLASASSLGVQRVLLNVAAYPWFSLALSGVALWAVVLTWRPNTGVDTRRFFYRFAAALVVVRFAIPLIAILNQGIYTAFLEPRYTESTRQLEQTAGTLQTINEETKPTTPDADTDSFLTSARRAFETARSSVDINERINALKTAAANMSEHTINLIVVFALQTILFPLLFLWLALQVLKYSVRMKV
jgi:hypothetical protein